MQARWQLHLLNFVLPPSCRSVVVAGRSSAKLEHYQEHMERLLPGRFDFQLTQSVQEMAQRSRLIVTCTNAKEPVLLRSHVAPGTHITAMGSDGVGKQELDANILAAADLVAVDSKTQCVSFGELSFAVSGGLLDMHSPAVVELGELQEQPWRSLDPSRADAVTVADCTGVAVQDVVIADWALSKLLRCQ